MFNIFSDILASDSKNNLFCQGDNFISKEKFESDITSYYNFFKNTDCETIAVFIPENTYLFYTVFMALLYAHKNIILLSQLTTNHLSGLKDKTTVIITDKKTEYDGFKCFLPQPAKAGRAVLPLIENLNIYFFTSGSTDQPKCIQKKLYTLLFEVKMHSQIQADLIKQNPTVLSSIAPFHMYGMLWRFLFSYLNGLLQDLDTILYPEELVEKQSLHEKIIFISTPSFMNELIVHKNNYQYEKNIFGIFSSGSLLTEELSKAVKSTFGVSPYEIYGSTETGGVAYRKQDEDSFWHVFPQVEIALQQNSCLRVNSEFSMYSPYDTSDIIEMLDDKTFILKERIDRMVKISEKRLSLPEMESFLNQWNYINESYVLTQETDRRILVAAVISLNDKGKQYIIKRGRGAFIMQMRKYLSKEFDNSFLPKKVRIVEKIPMNNQGKIIKSEIISLIKSKVQEPLVLNPTYSGNKFEATFVFEKNAAYFKGHFPKFPILPGVIQLHFAFYFLKNNFNVLPVKYTINKLKFTNLILPDAYVNFKLEKHSDQEYYFIYETTDKIYSSGIIRTEE